MKDKAIIFDMDGVLVNSEAAMRSAAIKSLSKYGVNAKPEDFKPFTGMGEDMFIGGVARKYGIEYSVKQKDLAYDIYVESAPDNVIVFDGVYESLKLVKDKGYKIAVASAADYIKVVTNLKCIGLTADFFDAVVTGSEVIHKKPAPDIFLKAAQKLGVTPENCIVVEDALSGITAALSAGMRVVAVTSSFPAEKLSDAGALNSKENIKGFDFDIYW